VVPQRSFQLNDIKSFFCGIAITCWASDGVERHENGLHCVAPVIASARLRTRRHAPHGRGPRSHTVTRTDARDARALDYAFANYETHRPVCGQANPSTREVAKRSPQQRRASASPTLLLTVRGGESGGLHSTAEVVEHLTAPLSSRTRWVTLRISLGRRDAGQPDRCILCASVERGRWWNR